MAPRDSMLNSSAPYLRYGEPVQAVIGAQAARPELPRATRLGHPGTGLWHQIPVGSEMLRVHRRFFADIETSDATMTDTTMTDSTTRAAA